MSSTSHSLAALSFAFLGGGNMASALISGLIAGGVLPGNIRVCAPSSETRQRLQADYDVLVQQKPDGGFAKSDVLVLAIKPQQLHSALPDLLPHLTNNLVISLLAGVRLDTLQREFQSSRLVRAMPSTPALIGYGMTGLVASESVCLADREIASALAHSVGQYLWLESDAQLDAVTAVSGSGPAYVYYLLEAMEQAAMTLGLSAAQARQLALATCHGSALLASQSAESPSLLRERVTSKGGTTEAAIQVLNDLGVKKAFVQAISAAAQRSRELSSELEASS